MKYLALSDPDKDLLIQLHDFIYLDTGFIETFIYNNYSSRFTVLNRLRRLEEAGYIKIFTVPIEGSSHPGNVYTLTAFGVEIVEQHQGFVHWRKRWTSQLPVWYPHQLGLNWIVKAYQTKLPEGWEVKDWVPEARATWQYTEDKSDVVKPDGILILGPRGKNEGVGYMFELERSIAKRINTIRKVMRYNDFLNRGDELLKKYDLRVGFEAEVIQWRVLFIGNNETNTKKTIRDLRNVEDINIKVLVASRGDVENDPYGKIYRNINDPETLTTL